MKGATSGLLGVKGLFRCTEHCLLTATKFYEYITLYIQGERICSVWGKPVFQNKKTSWKKFPMSAAIVGRRYEPILGYISKIDGKNNSGHKGLMI